MSATAADIQSAIDNARPGTMPSGPLTGAATEFAAEQLKRLQARRQQSNGHLAEVLRLDPILTSRIINHVNAARRQRQPLPGDTDPSAPSHAADDSWRVCNAPHAIVLLGLEQSKSLLASVPVHTGKRLRTETARIGYRGCLVTIKRAFFAATLAQSLAEQFHDPSPDDVFTAAQLMHLPELALWSSDPVRVATLEYAGRMSDSMTSNVEARALGASVHETAALMHGELELTGDAMRALENCYATSNLRSEEPGNRRIIAAALGYRMAQATFLGWSHPAIAQAMDEYANFARQSMDRTVALVHSSAAVCERQLARLQCFGPAQALLGDPGSLVEARQQLLAAELTRAHMRENTPEPSSARPRARQGASDPSGQTKAQRRPARPGPGEISQSGTQRGSKSPSPPSDTPTRPRSPAVTPVASTAVTRSIDEAPATALLDQLASGQIKLGTALQGLCQSLVTDFHFDRSAFALLNKDRSRLQFRIAAGDDAKRLTESLSVAIDGENLLARLMEKRSAVWVNAGNLARYRKIIPVDFLAATRSDHFMAVSVFANQKPLGLFYADTLSGEQLNETNYRALRTFTKRLGEVVVSVSK